MDKVKCLRIYSDAQGESHFGEFEVELKLTHYAPPAAPFGVSSPLPAARLLFASCPAGFFGDWHPTPCRQLLVLLRGESEVEASDGEVRHLRPGDFLLAEDSTGKGHRSRVVGADEYVNVFVHLPD